MLYASSDHQTLFRFSLGWLYGLVDTQIDLVYPTITELDTGILSAALPGLRSRISVLNALLNTFVLRYDLCYGYEC